MRLGRLIPGTLEKEEKEGTVSWLSQLILSFLTNEYENFVDLGDLYTSIFNNDYLKNRNDVFLHFVSSLVRITLSPSSNTPKLHKA